MPGLDHEISRGLERLTSRDGHGPGPTFEQLSARRRRRRARRTALAVVPVVAVLALAVGAPSFWPDDEVTNIATGPDGEAPSTPETSSEVTMKRIEVDGAVGGTTRVVMQFDGPLPRSEVSYIDEDDIGAYAPDDGMVYTVQDAGGVDVCGDTHSFPAPAEGTVDLLIPADWYAVPADWWADRGATHRGRIINNSAKFVPCGPYRGYYQYSIWGPVSVDPADVTISVTPDRSRLTVEIAEPGATPGRPPTVDEATPRQPS